MNDERPGPGAYSLLLHAALIRSLAALRAAGVPVIVLKGAAFASTIYPSLADRPMVDVDLLVHPQDRERCPSRAGRCELPLRSGAAGSFQPVRHRVYGRDGVSPRRPRRGGVALGADSQ